MTNLAASTPLVSVIVPVYRNPDGLRICLDALAKQIYPGSRFEVVVIDNGGNGDLAPIVAEYANVLLCHEDNPSSYAARNAGVESARGAILAFTDSDCIPAPTWLAAGVDVLDGSPLVDAIAGNVEVFVRDPASPNALEIHQLIKGFYHDRAVREEDRATTANLITYREIFEKVGPFRADFQSGGDAEWCRCAASKGYSLGYAPECLVLHPARFSFLDFSLRYVRTTGGKFSLCRARGEAPLTIRALLGHLAPPLLETRKVRAHPALGFPFGKSKFFGVEYWVRVIRVVETLRLLLGGKPIRY